jgi:hypothetical protein
MSAVLLNCSGTAKTRGHARYIIPLYVVNFKLTMPQLAKKRLGSFGRAKRKVDEMTKIIAESRRTGQH